MKEAKVLLKDLPFNKLKKGSVVTIWNGDYIIDNGETWYDGKLSGSHNGHTHFDSIANDILETIWNNDSWFKPQSISSVKYSRTSKSIELSFDSPLNLDNIEMITRGIKKTLELHYKDTVKNMGWTDELIEIMF
ncbi:MAG: hypothetical protein IID03_12550 [Candidatus Dadabacteria bacterium]|nr:hypothetical protein [Candidatus Dadabacteria bacterium]